MTKTIRIEDADYDTIITNADGRSAADEVHRMLTGNVTNVTNSVTNVIDPELKAEIKSLMSRMDTFMSHGQGGIRVYPMPVDKVDGKCVPRVVEYEKGEQTITIEGVGEMTVPARDLGFRRASLRAEK
jgi:hypothetical protein